MTRHIGIRHRVKCTVQGEARPTQMALLVDGAAKPRLIDLDTEDDELDFLQGRLPTAWRKLEDGEGVPPGVLPRHVKETAKARKIPTAYDGFASGDVVATVAGGSGSNFTFALSRRGEEIGAEVLVIPPGSLKEWRTTHDSERDDDAALLAALAKDMREIFKPVARRDRDLITIVETWRDREDAMKARIAAEQRLRQRMIGKVFRNEEGRYPEGALEDAYDAARASDPIVQALVKEERRLNKMVEDAVQAMPIYREFLSGVEGCGPLIAARIIAGIGDIRRFETLSGFKAYCGVHVCNGAFPRRKKGSRANWSALARQGFYLFVGDQCVKRKDSEWGQKLRAYKAQFRTKHPEPSKDGKRTLYTDGHIHRMAIWRTATRFAEALFRKWRQLEGLAGPAQTPKKERPVPATESVAAA